MHPVTAVVACTTFSLALAYLCWHFVQGTGCPSREVPTRFSRPRYVFVCDSCGTERESYNATRPKQQCRSCYWQRCREKLQGKKKSTASEPVAYNTFGRADYYADFRSDDERGVRGVNRNATHSRYGDTPSGYQENAIRHLEGD